VISVNQLGAPRRAAQLTIVGHGENRNLGDGTVSSLDSTGSLVKSSQISVEVTGVTSSTGNFFSSSGNFSQSIGVADLSIYEGSERGLTKTYRS
jgi:hypothetical protein